MEVRHIVFGAVFVAIFGIGMLNVMSDGRFAHQISSHLPNHAGGGNASIGEIEPVVLKPGESRIETIEIRNAKRISYEDPALISNNSISFDMSLQPPPSGVEQSMPPNYVYDHQERTVEASLNFSAGESAISENLTFNLKAKPGNIDSLGIEREVSVQIR